MTYLTQSRDALAKALYESFEWSGCAGSSWEKRHEATREKWRQNADALIASGAVIPAATLADDEALVDVIATHTPDLVALAADGVSEGEHLYCVECGVLPGTVQNGAQHVAQMVATALTERSQ